MIRLSGFEPASAGEMATFSTREYSWDYVAHKVQWSNPPAVTSVNVGPETTVAMPPFSVVYVRIPAKSSTSPARWAQSSTPAAAAPASGRASDQPAIGGLRWRPRRGVCPHSIGGHAGAGFGARCRTPGHWRPGRSRGRSAQGSRRTVLRHSREAWTGAGHCHAGRAIRFIRTHCQAVRPAAAYLLVVPGTEAHWRRGVRLGLGADQ